MNFLSRKILPWVSTVILSSLPAGAETLEKTALMIIQQNATTEMGIGLPFPSQAGAETTRTYSGTFSTSIKFDSRTLIVEGFKFNGGEILASAYSLIFQDFVNYPSPYNTKSTVVTKIPFNNNSALGVIRLSPETRENGGGDIEFGEVNTEGKLRNLDHKYFADQGAYQTWHSVNLPPASAQDVRIDNYNPGVNLLYRGTSTVDIREVSSTIYEKSVRAYLTIELDELEVTTLQGKVPALDLTVVETEIGTIVANTGQFKVPTNYGDWATDNGLTKPNPETLNPAGIPYAILFALDLPITATSLPVSVENTSTGAVAKIILPESGLRNPMSVEYSANLADSDWPELPATYYVDGPDSLDLGKTGEPRFGFPSGNGGFIRFVSVVE